MPPPPPGNHNIVRELSAASLARSSGEPIDLCIWDFPLRGIAAAERLMLHPEHGEDFEDRASFGVDNIGLFEDYPDDDLSFDRQLGQLKVNGPNCVKMDGAGTISGLSRVRLQELSVHRAYRTTQGLDHDSTAGKYHLSIVMLATEPILPDDSQPVLRVTLSA